MKKFVFFLFFICAAVLCLTACNPNPTTTTASKKTPSQGLAFTLSEDGTYYILSGRGSCADTSIIIPSMYEELPVKEIGENAFFVVEKSEDFSEIVSVTIPDSVTTIGNYAFAYCKGLTSVTFGLGIKTVGDRAFLGCESLTSVAILDTVESIGESAFSQCVSMESAVFADTLKTVGELAFINCKQLISVTLGDNLEAIPNSAFARCENLRAIFGGSRIQSIGNRAFEDCKSLVQIDIPKTVKSIGDEAFSRCESIQIAVIPDGIESIGFYTFYGCKAMRTVVIPKSLTSIGVGAFRECEGLEEIFYYGAEEDWASITVGTNNAAFTDTVHYYYSKTQPTEEGNYWRFENNAYLIWEIPSLHFWLSEDETYYIVGGIGDLTNKTDITIPSTYKGLPVKRIAASAFYGCENLVSVTVSAGVESIEDSAFYGCSNLASVILADSVTSIDALSFSSCPKLSLVQLSENLTEIGSMAFYESPLATKTYNGCKYVGTASNPYYAVVDMTSSTATTCVLHEDTKLIADAGTGDLCPMTTLVIPASVSYINDYAFYNCYELTNISVAEESTAFMSVDGNLYTKDGKTLVHYATAKTDTSFTILDGVETIGARAFASCSNLVSISMPNSVTTIREEAFANCIYLTSMTLSTSLKTIEPYAFWDCEALTAITIPAGVTSIGTAAFAACFGLQEFRVAESNAAYQSIGGNLYTKDGKTLVQYAAGKTAASFSIPNTVTTIGKEAFYGCKYLASVTIPASVKEIEYGAFALCESLTHVTFSSQANWWCGSFIDTPYELGDKISPSSLADPKNAATLLLETYCYEYWHQYED